MNHFLFMWASTKKKIFAVNIFFVLISLFFSLYLRAQVQVKGIIADSISGNPLSSSTIRLINKSTSATFTTTTDSTGQFYFNTVQGGKYQMEITAINYNAYTIDDLLINSDGELFLLPAIKLKRDKTSLKEVTVISRQNLIEINGNKMVLNVSNSILATSNSVNELLQQFPGLSVGDNGQMRLNGKSGIAVMIDGKISSLSVSELSEYLKNLPSTSISKIEVLANPPAQYDAVGSAGIINILTKKTSKAGINGSVTTGYNQGIYPNFLNSATLNVKKGKWVFGAFYNYNRLRRFVHYTAERFIEGIVPINFRQETTYWPIFNNHLAKADINFNINKSSALEVTFNWNSFQRDRTIHDSTYISNRYNEIDSIYFTKTRNIKRLDHMAYAFNYNKHFDSLGRKIEVGYALLKYKNFDDRFSYHSYYKLDGSILREPSAIRNNVPYTIYNNIFRIDYTYPLDQKSKLEAGIKGSWTKQINKLIFDSLQRDRYVNIEIKNSTFRYTENIAAMYISLFKQIGKYNIIAGLRVEQTNASSNFITAKKIVKFNYLNWFPSLSVTSNFSKHRIGLDMNRRIGRPSYQNLDPTLIYFTQYYYIQGNIALQPQYTNIFTLTNTYKNKYIATLRYSRTDNLISDIQHIDSVTNVLTTKVTNLDVAHNIGLSVNVPVKITKWWNMYTNVFVFYEKTTGNYMGKDYSRHLTGYGFNNNNTFSGFDDYRFELIFKYDSPQMYGFSRLDAIYSLSIGAQKALMNKKANIKLGVYDLLNTLVYVYKYNYANVNAREERQVNLRQLQLSFTYNFGTSSSKSKKYNMDTTNERMKDQ